MAALKMDDALQEQVKQLLAAASKKVSFPLFGTLQRLPCSLFERCCRSRSSSCWQPRPEGSVSIDNLHVGAVALKCV